MNLERAIRQQVYGKDHRVQIFYPAGFRTLAAQEVKETLARLLSPGHAGPFQIFPAKGHLVLDHAGLTVGTELVLRLLVAWDVRMEIQHGPATSEAAVLGMIERAPLELYWSPGQLVAVKVDSIASDVQRERWLRGKIAAKLAGRGFQPLARSPLEMRKQVKTQQPPEDHEPPQQEPQAEESAAGSPAGAAEQASPQLLRVELRRNRCSLVLSLAGEPLYRRGYRASLGSHAPLREDIAAAICGTFLDHARACCQTEDRPWSQPDLLLLPFAGSGTLAFELLLVSRQIAACLLPRTYAFETWICHRARAADWLRRRLAGEAQTALATALPLRVVAFDRNEEEVTACRGNMARFGRAIDAASRGSPAFQAEAEVADFWQADLVGMVPVGARHVALPLNPPYGLRLARGSLDVPRFYNGLARKVSAAAAALAGQGAMISGCILCPDEPTWRAFLAGLQDVRSSTAHFSQGGLDVRLCAFARTAAGVPSRAPG